MKLKHLSLNKIIDTAYLCGINGTPIYVLIAAPSGAGKTWATKSVSNMDFVQYLNKVYSPKEHRAIVGKDAQRTKLLINDDIGLCARWNAKEYFATFCMVMDGELLFKMFKNTEHAFTKFSVVLLCTSDYFYAYRDDMSAIGLLSRVIPIILELSEETRKGYNEAVMSGGGRDPPMRTIEIKPMLDFKGKILSAKNPDPRLLINLKYASQFLNRDEFTELIDVAHSNGKYEV